MPYQHQYTYRRSQPIPPRPSGRRSLLRKMIVPGLTLLVAGIVVVSHMQSQLMRDLSPKASAEAKDTAAVAQAAKQATLQIQSIIAGDTSDTIGVAIENMKTGAVTTYGATTPFEVASTEKVLSAVTYYHLVEKGKLSLDDQVGAYPASYQIQQMINQSNNDSWNALNDALGGNDELQAYANSIGLQYKVDGNLMRPQDMATLLTKLYTGKLLNADHTAQLLSYMQNTNDESMIPSVIPGGLTVYHKYGELDDIDDDGDSVLHDAAIVSDGATTYAIVIYTSGSSATQNRTTIVQNIARQALIVCGW